MEKTPKWPWKRNIIIIFRERSPKLPFFLRNFWVGEFFSRNFWVGEIGIYNEARSLRCSTSKKVGEFVASGFSVIGLETQVRKGFFPSNSLIYRKKYTYISLISVWSGNFFTHSSRGGWGWNYFQNSGFWSRLGTFWRQKWSGKISPLRGFRTIRVYIPGPTWSPEKCL